MAHHKPEQLKSLLRQSASQGPGWLTYACFGCRARCWFRLCKAGWAGLPMHGLVAGKGNASTRIPGLGLA